MPISNDLANKLANATVRNVSYSSPATVYVALYSTAPTAATSGTELSGSGYTRESVTFDTPTAGTVASNVAVSFGAATADWLPAVAIAVTDASTSGNIMRERFTGLDVMRQKRQHPGA